MSLPLHVVPHVVPYTRCSQRLATSFRFSQRPKRDFTRPTPAKQRETRSPPESIRPLLQPTRSPRRGSQKSGRGNEETKASFAFKVLFRRSIEKQLVDVVFQIFKVPAQSLLWHWWVWRGVQCIDHSVSNSSAAICCVKVVQRGRLSVELVALDLDWSAEVFQVSRRHFLQGDSGIDVLRLSSSLKIQWTSLTYGTMRLFELSSKVASVFQWAECSNWAVGLRWEGQGSIFGKIFIRYA